MPRDALAHRAMFPEEYRDVSMPLEWCWPNLLLNGVTTVGDRVSWQGKSYRLAFVSADRRTLVLTYDGGD